MARSLASLGWRCWSCSSAWWSRCSALLVAGLLRSHAEILRALHELGVDLDPSRPDGVDTPVAAPGGRGATSPTVRSSEVPTRPSRGAVDVVGTAPDGDAVSIAVTGRNDLTLLAFLSSGCGSCHFFWDAFARRASLEVPGDARLVVVTKGPRAEQPGDGPQARAARQSRSSCRARRGTTTTCRSRRSSCSSTASRATVIGEGAANTWEHVTALLHTALDDAGLLDRKGRRRSARRHDPRADVMREDRVDRDLLAAGIRPGDPSLYALPDALDTPGPSDASPWVTPPGCRRADRRVPRVTDLEAHGVSVTLPAGWEGRVFAAPEAGEAPPDDLASSRLTPRRQPRRRRVGPTEASPAPEETTNTVVHVATIALPPGSSDFASDSVDRLGPTDALIVLFEYDREAAIRAAVRASPGSRGCSQPTDFSPSVLQRSRARPGRRAGLLPRGRPRLLPLRRARRVRRASAGRARGEPCARDAWRSTAGARPR